MFISKSLFTVDGIGTLSDYNAQGALAALESVNGGKDAVIVSQNCDVPAVENLRQPDNVWKGSIA